MVGVRLECGDCLEVMPRLAAAGVRVDAVVTDAPYHLASIVARLGSPDAAPIQSGVTGVYARSSSGFMGQTWDGGDIAFRAETWRAAYELMRPGAQLICFGGTRTFARMQVAIEDAGFEIRDSILDMVATDTLFQNFAQSLNEAQLDAFAKLLDSGSAAGDLLAWVYGTGFPKSHNLDGEWEGWGTALKPAWEPIVLARKPLLGSVQENMDIFGTGAINIDGCRVPIGDEVFDGGGQSRNGVNVDTHHDGWTRPWMRDADAVAAHRDRLQANVDKARQLGRWPANVVHDGSEDVISAFPESAGAQGDVRGHSTERQSPNGVFGKFGPAVDREARRDSGSAARFFYSAKATKADRAGSHHPTVKPVSLMQWLVRMVCPPGGLVLDPFAGSGTTGAAAIAEGRQALLIEREPEYQADIRRRFDLEGGEQVAARPVSMDLGPLFKRAAP